MSSATRDDYRFSVEDEARALEALRRTYGEWREPLELTGVEVETLRRIGAHAIGCSVDDLRGSEHDWLTCRIGELLG